jgi:hypothetical protein
MRGYPRINTRTMELEWYISYSMFKAYASQLEEVSTINGVRDLSFLKYISPNAQADYKKSLSEMDDAPSRVRDGGLVKRALNGGYSEDELSQISQAFFAGGK